MAAKIRRFQERLQQIAASIENTGGNSDGMPRGTSISDPTRERAIRLIEAQDRLRAMIVEAETVRQRISDEIERVDGVAYQELLYSRYILGLSWSGVTERVSLLRDRPYDEVYVRGRMHSDALIRFREKNPNF